MASTALEEKINKIRLQNEEIKRRYEEVEADKKNAAKLDALVEPVPVEDWPERKEPPEFSAPAPKHANKLKYSVRKHNDQTAQYYTSSGDGKKAHNFADGQGPPPDPKYNFLADSEREEHGDETPRETERNRGRSKPTRGIFKRRGSGRDWHAKEQWNQQGSQGDATRPDYEAWRAERNRIDEARISRQRTAEGNWRREWDNDKIHLADEVSKRDNRVTLGDVVTRQEHSDNEKLYRSSRTAPRNSQHSNVRESYHGIAVSETNKCHGSVSDPEKRIVVATDKSIKVMLNPGSTPPKSSVMSVKVSPPNIAGTGRVGPRQRPRVMYSSQPDAEATHETPTFTRQKSADDKIKSRPFDQTLQAIPSKSPHPQRKRDGDQKSPHPQRKDNDRGDKFEGMLKTGKKDTQKSPYPQRRGNAPGNYPPKSPRVHRRSTEAVRNEFGKLPRAQQERNRGKCSVSEESKEKGIDGDVLVSADASAASKHKKSNELFSQFDSIDKNNENVSIEPFPRNSTESVLESEKNCIIDHDKKNDSALSEQPAHESSTSSAEGVLYSAENNTVREFKDTHGEASGTQEPKDTLSDDLDEGSTSNKAIINCSASSGLTSNDSGFIELPNNDSIHDISDNVNVETSDFAETSVDSVPSETEVMENLEVEHKIVDTTVGDIAEPSPSDLEIRAEDSEENNIIETTDTPSEAENNSGNTVVDVTELERLEEDSPTSSKVHAEPENNANILKSEVISDT